MKQILTSGLALGVFAMVASLPAAAADDQGSSLLELCRQQAQFNEVDQEELAAYIEECLQDSRCSEEMTKHAPAPSMEKEGRHSDLDAGIERPAVLDPAPDVLVDRRMRVKTSFSS